MESRNAHNTPTTKFRIASLSKQFTAACILLLQEQKRLRVRDPGVWALCKHRRGANDKQNREQQWTAVFHRVLLNRELAGRTESKS